MPSCQCFFFHFCLFKNMRLRHITFYILVGCFMSLMVYSSIAKKLMQDSISPKSSSSPKKSDRSPKETIKVAPMNPIIMPPLLSNPMSVQQGLQSSVVVQSSLVEFEVCNLRNRTIRTIRTIRTKNTIFVLILRTLMYLTKFTPSTIRGMLQRMSMERGATGIIRQSLIGNLL